MTQKAKHTKGPTMNDDLTDEQRARALELHRLYHTCESVWRPTTRDEIQAGWEVRSRGQGGYERAWGTAHRRDATGDWFTESGRQLTLGVCWTYETTAPEPEPDEGERLVRAVAQRSWGVWNGLHGSHLDLDALPDDVCSYWLDKVRQAIAGLEDDGFTIEPKPREEGAS